MAGRFELRLTLRARTGGSSVNGGRQGRTYFLKPCFNTVKGTSPVSGLYGKVERLEITIQLPAVKLWAV